MGDATVNGASFSMALNLAEGEHVLAVTAFDSSGNPSPETDFTVLVDTTPPQAPVGLAIAPDDGVSATDGLTDTGALTLTGVLAEANLSVEVFDATTRTDLGSAVVTGTALTATLNLAAGPHNLTLVATDAAGNTSEASSFDVVVDTTPPQISPLAPVSPNPRNTAVATEDVTFSKPIDTTTFDLNDLLLTRNGGTTNLISSPSSVAIAPVSGNTYRISGLGSLTTADGSYKLTVMGVGIRDLAGNATTNAPAVSWLMDSHAPTSKVAPLSARRPASASRSSSMGLTPRSYLACQPRASPPTTSTFPPMASPSCSGRVSPTPAALRRPTTLARAAIPTPSAACAHARAGNVEVKPVTIEASTFVPDLTAPTTQVTAVDAATSTFTIHFAGTDAGGSGLASVSLYVVLDGGTTPQLIGTFPAGSPGSGGVYAGVATYQALADGSNHAYRFYSIGVDGANNTEPAKAAPADVVVNTSFPAPASLQVTSFVVQHGLTERSFVQYLDLTFNQSTSQTTALGDIANLANNRIHLYRRDLVMAGGVASLSSPVAVPLSQLELTTIDHVIEINFGSAGVGGNANSSVGDGYYELAIDLGGGVIEQSLLLPPAGRRRRQPASGQ